jgi:hypothetical protein
MLAIGLVAGAALATSATAFAGPALEKITATLRPDYIVKVDGKQVQLKNPPISYNGTTYIPLREAGEILGRTVGFKDGTITLDQQQPAETGGKDDGIVSAVTPVEVTWIALDQLGTYGISVIDDGKILTFSKGEAKLTFKSPADDSVQMIPGGYSIKKEGGKVYLSKPSLDWLLNQ